MPMAFEWEEEKAAANLSKHGVSFDEAKREKPMKKAKKEMEDALRPEYDLRHLQVRRLGPGRKSFGGSVVRLEPDVAEVFPSAESVNEALRFLIRIAKDKKPTLRETGDDA